MADRKLCSLLASERSERDTLRSVQLRIADICNWASEASPTLGCSIEISRNIIYVYIQVKKKAFKINAKIEDVGLNED